jgi:hypothetical protein
MVSSGIQLWKLSSGCERSLGLSCTEEGLFLCGAALIERGEHGFVLRPRVDLERLLARAYGSAVVVDRVMPGLSVVVAGLEKRNLCLAQIAALHLRMPDLPDEFARRSLDAEDRLIKIACDDALARGGWDPAKHPRAGVPPNPGWFAPTGGAETPGQIAQGEEEERAPEEILDPMAPLRQALWDAAIATLRRIDPGNPQLSYITSPGWVPSNLDIAGINAEIGRVVTRRATNFLIPGGHPIGRAGGGRDIREVEGGAHAAQKAFDYLSVGGVDVTPSTYAGKLVELPGNVGYVGLRSSAAGPAIDVNVPGAPIERCIINEQSMNASDQVNEIVEDYVRHSQVDYIGLWQIASRIREDLGPIDNAKVRQQTIVVVRRLIEREILAGDYVKSGFRFWDDDNPEAIIARIEKEWDPEHGDPTLANPICWFARKRS